MRAAVAAAFHLPAAGPHTRAGERWEEEEKERLVKKVGKKGRQLFHSFLKAASFDPCNYTVERLDPVCSTTFSSIFFPFRPSKVNGPLPSSSFSFTCSCL